MRIHRVRIRCFKGVEVAFPWASALVFFGANDSGKTNILEAFVSQLGVQGTVRTEPRSREEGDTVVELDVELDGLDCDGHPDQETFLRLLLAENVDETYWNPDTFDNDESGSVLFGELEEARTRFAAYLSGMGGRFDWMPKTFNKVLEIAAKTAGLASGEDAMALHEFTVAARHLEWRRPREGDEPQESFWESDLTDPGYEWSSLDSLLDPLLRVIRVEPHEGADAALFERLERVLQRLICRYPPELDGDESYAGSSAAKSIHDQRRRSPWLVRRDDLAGLRPSMQQACADLGARINELAPPFVSASYTVEITPLSPEEWQEHHGHHVAMRLRARSTGKAFDLQVASSGVATWTGFVLSEALRPIEEQKASLDNYDPPIAVRPSGSSPLSGDSSQPARQTVYIFDEPETHLHPLAQEQAAAWIAERVQSGAHVMLATHAVPFLGLPVEDVEYFKVSRSQTWETKVERITEDVLGAVAESAEALGLAPVALIQLTRAWLVVEGEHDRKIIESLYGRELGRARIQILPLRGARNAKASFLHLGALAHLGQPFFCLLDNTNVDAVKTGRLPTDRMTEEERIAEQVWRLSQEDGVDVRIFGLPHPDIICELPIEAVRQVAAENGGKPQAASAWSDLIEHHQQRSTEASNKGKRGPNFKTFVLDSIGLGKWSPDKFVEETLRVCDTPSQASALSRIVSEIAAATGDGRLGAD